MDAYELRIIDWSSDVCSSYLVFISMRRVAWIILAWALCCCSAPTGPSDARDDDIQACNTERVSTHRMLKQEHKASRGRNVVDRLARRIRCAMVARPKKGSG